MIREIILILALNNLLSLDTALLYCLQEGPREHAFNFSHLNRNP